MKTMARICILLLGGAAACAYDANQLAGPPTREIDGSSATGDGDQRGIFSADDSGGTSAVDGTITPGGSLGAGGSKTGDAPIATGGIAAADGAEPSTVPDASIASLDTQQMDSSACSTGYRQDDAGNSFCCSRPLNVLSFGQPGGAGAGNGTDNTDAFQSFMSGNNNGTSTLQMLKKHTSIATIDLGQYDIIILQALEDDINSGNIWTISQSETDALAKWVQDGGSLISMCGYGAHSNEVQPLNQLLGGSNKWSGISYNTDDILGTCPENFCYCTDGSIPFDGWQTDYADYDQITRNLKKVAVFYGRSINCTGSDCQAFAEDSSGNKVGVAKKIGRGRIFA